ncbi:MAG: beta-propeller fold lactonase family protein [Chloroflexi bacterium]|nr:beta-propeller fold lactonase family protein [Chloroflexota bacterium]
MINRNLASLMRLLRGQEAGLTAIELAVVMAVLAILAGIVAGSVTGMNQAARGAAQVTDKAEVQKAIDRWVGEQPASRYPVGTPVIVDANNVPAGSASPASNGLPASGSGLYARILFGDGFTNPEGATKRFIPDHLQRLPKHGGDTPNPWVVDERGTVSFLTPPTPAGTSTPMATPTRTSTSAPTPTGTATPTTTATAAPGGSGLAIVGTVSLPAAPRRMAVNSSTHRAYVAVGNSWSPSTYYVSVISGTIDIADIPVGTGDYSTGPTWLAVNDATNRVYVDHTGANFANAIDAGTNTVIGNIATGAYPEGIVTNPQTNRLYIANTNSGNVSVFDTTNDANPQVATVGIPGSGAGITNLYLAIIPATNRIYVTAPGLNKIFVVDGGSNTIAQTFSLTWSPSSAIVASASRLYVADQGAGTVNVLDPTTGASIATVSVGSNPVYSVAINSARNHLYATSNSSSLLTVIDGATNSVIGTIDVGATGYAVAADASNGRVYVGTAANTVVVLSD